MHILDQEVPGLSDKIRSLSLENRRRVLAKACQLASESIINLEPVIQDLLQCIASERTLSKTQLSKANSLAEAADENYFRMQGENRSEEEWLNWFFKARLLAAIGTGFGGDSWSDVADAVYELSKSRKDPSPIFAVVESDIRTIRNSNDER